MSSDSSSTTSSRSSRTSALRLDMPSTISVSPDPQNPTSTDRHHPHTPQIPHLHIATPHPLSAATQYLDKHVPVFAKHHTEYSVNRAARTAKREARHSLLDSPIPEYEYEYKHEVDVEYESDQHRVSTALRTAAVTTFAPALADGEGIVTNREGDDNEAWMAVLAKREAARLRSGSGLSAGSSSESSHGHAEERSAGTNSSGSGSEAWLKGENSFFSSRSP
ncbi:hypothetical protein RBB50_007293 [Rhinocladiella similis]